MVKAVSRRNEEPSRPWHIGPSRGNRALKRTKRALSVLRATGDLFGSSVDIARQFRRLGLSLDLAAHAARGPDIVLGLLNAHRAVKDVQEALDSSKKPAERARSCLSLVLDADSIVNTVASICKIIYAAAGPLAKKAVEWIPIFNLVSFAVSFLSLGLSAYSTHQARKLFDGFSEAMKECLNTTDQTKKAEALSKALDIIDREGIDPLRKQLILSKEAGEELDCRVQSLRKHIKAKHIGAKDEELMHTLVGRAKTQLGFKVAEVATSVAGVAAGVLFVTPVPFVGQVVGLSVLAATGVASLVSSGARYFLINKNPFDEKSHSRAVQALNAISKAISALKQRLATIGLGKQHLPQMAV